MGLLERLFGASIAILTLLILGVAGVFGVIPNLRRYLKIKRM